MKRLLSFMLVIVLLCGFAGCGNTEEGNVDYVDIIANSCGHKRKDGTEISYDLALRVCYSSNAISWDAVEYDQLKQKEFRAEDVNYNPITVPLKPEYKYAVVHVRSDETNTDIFFAYDPSIQRVIGGFSYGQEYNFYYETWSIYESSYCHYYCHCKK